MMQKKCRSIVALSIICSVGIYGKINASSIHETILPLKFNTGNTIHGLPSSFIEIQGKNIPVIVDTGASKYAVALSPYALQKIKVHYLPEKNCSKTISRKVCMQTFVIPELKIGQFSLYNIRGVVMQKLWGGNDVGFQHTQASKSGVIGLKLLSHYGVLLDYAHSRAILTENNTFPSNYKVDQWIKVPFNLQGGITTMVNINGLPQKLLWDTGAVPSILRSTTLTNKQSYPCPKDSYFNSPECRLVKAAQLSINGKTIPNNWFRLNTIDNSIPFDGIVGSNYYEQNTLFFDFHNKFIYIQKN